MAENQVIRKRIAQARGQEDGQTGLAPHLEKALARAAQSVLSMPLAVKNVVEARTDVLGLDQNVTENDLLLLVMSGEEALGILGLSPELVGSVLSMKMTGAVRAQVGQRPPTRVDAELCRPLMDGVLGGLASMVDGGIGGVLPPTSGGMMADARLIRFSLPEVGYSTFSATLDIGNGALEGRVFLALAEKSGPSTVSTGAGDWHSALSANVLEADMTVSAELARLGSSLAAVRKLAVGDLLSLPADTLDGVRLRLGDGAVVGQGRLGRTHAHRAVRIASLAAPKTKGAPNLSSEAPAVSGNHTSVPSNGDGLGSNV